MVDILISLTANKPLVVIWSRQSNNFIC